MKLHLPPNWAKAFYFFWFVILLMTSLVVAVNLWALLNHVFYSLPGLFIFTGISLGIVYVMTLCQRLGWPE